MLVWVDLETTGLDPHVDQILEVACVVTDDDLVEKSLFSYVVKPRRPLRMEPVVVDMHRKNGLLDLCDQAAHPIELVEEIFAEWLLHEIYGVTESEKIEKPPLCGSTISFDRSFLQAHAPLTLKHLHYRNVDVSTVKELVRRWAPNVAEAWKERCQGAKPHRALEDVRHSIEELKFYRTILTARVY